MCVDWKSNKKKKREKKTKAERTTAKAQCTEAKSSMAHTSLDLAELLISIGKIVQREESKDYEDGNPKTTRMESDAAVTLARPLNASKNGRSKEIWKDQASDS